MRIFSVITSGLVLAGLLAMDAGEAAAQAASGDLALRFDEGRRGERLFDRAPINSEQRYVLIRLEENRLYVMDGERAVWSAPVGTGTGFTLEGAGRRWEFSTPHGVFRVQRKEKDPVWIRPDWVYVRDGRPIPPRGAPERRDTEMLGTTAIYIGYELAIHGTNAPELLLRPDPEDRRVSHGCIRLTNEDARMLYHMVEIGTPVLIY
jgi:lipoprotein-anchoring transpeptidase ErfK/SrfK